MALALLFTDDSVMYLDAVTNYTKSYSSNISNHPIDKSAVITDHVSKDNPSFSIRGVISAADFHTTYLRPRDFEEENIGVEYNQPVNGAVIKAPSSRLDYLPRSIQQFLSSTNDASVTVDSFRGYSHQIARDRLETAWSKSEIITLLDYDYDFTTGRTVHVKRIQNCLISNYTDNEDSTTGDSLDFTITFQKVRFAYLKEVDIQVTRSEVSDAAAGESEKGEQGGGEGGEGSEERENQNAWQKAKRTSLGEELIGDIESTLSIVTDLFGGG